MRNLDPILNCRDTSILIIKSASCCPCEYDCFRDSDLYEARNSPGIGIGHCLPLTSCKVSCHNDTWRTYASYFIDCKRANLCAGDILFCPTLPRTIELISEIAIVNSPDGAVICLGKLFEVPDNLSGIQRPCRQNLKFVWWKLPSHWLPPFIDTGKLDFTSDISSGNCSEVVWIRRDARPIFIVPKIRLLLIIRNDNIVVIGDIGSDHFVRTGEFRPGSSDIVAYLGVLEGAWERYGLSAKGWKEQGEENLHKFYVIYNK